MINNDEKDNLFNLSQSRWTTQRDWFEFITRKFCSDEKNLASSWSGFFFDFAFLWGDDLSSISYQKGLFEWAKTKKKKVENLLLLCKQSVTNIWHHLSSLPVRSNRFFFFVLLENCVFPVRHKLFTKDNFLLKDGKFIHDVSSHDE